MVTLKTGLKILMWGASALGCMYTSPNIRQLCRDLLCHSGSHTVSDSQPLFISSSLDSNALCLFCQIPVGAKPEPENNMVTVSGV